ncbi:MAG: alpha-glucoside transport system substrate-binding protein [Chloroflexota bacterium]|nr:alpha-glucoside transport system substrate-binding protein [Chloroflexota bacterium]
MPVLNLPSVRATAVALTIVAALGLGCSGTPQTGRIGGTVSVVASWSGAEQEAFLAMVRPFEQESGVTVQYKGTRDLNGYLWQSIAQGDPPDVAGLPGPGQMAEFARHGSLKDLSSVIDVSGYKADTVPAFVDLGTVDGKLVGVFIKATLKGLIWFNPHDWTVGTPANWVQLEADANLARRGDSKTWCMGLASDATSGWPGTDWIEDIVLRQSGPDVYDEWVAGRLPWTAPEIKKAFELYGTVVADTDGGSASIIATNFGDAGNHLFTDPPGCLLHHQATFMTSFFQSRAGARDGEYDFFPFPTIDGRFSNSVTGAGDLFGMFRETPQARALMSYLMTPAAQSIWVARGGALSVNVHVNNYPDEISSRAASTLANADRFRYDASDLMPEQVNEAFLQGVIDYVRDPASLDAILQRIDEVQRSTINTAPVR